MVGWILDLILNELGSIVMRGLLLWVAVLIPVVTGCNDEAENKVLVRRTNLEMVAKEYRRFFDDNERAPRDNEEFKESIKSQDDDSKLNDLLTSINEGDIVIFWNGKLDEADESDLLAFEANVPGGGGYAVTVKGEVKLITAAQFNSLGKITQSE